LYDIRPGNGAVYSYNPGARTGLLLARWHFSTWEAATIKL